MLMLMLGMVLIALSPICTITLLHLNSVHLHFIIVSSGHNSSRGLGWVGLGLVWFGLVWFGLVWFGLVWFCTTTDLPLPFFQGIDSNNSAPLPHTTSSVSTPPTALPSPPSFQGDMYAIDDEKQKTPKINQIQHEKYENEGQMIWIQLEMLMIQHIHIHIRIHIRIHSTHVIQRP